jgi:hypothetical protein
MPYITKAERETWSAVLLPLTDRIRNNIVTPGALNYLITRIVDEAIGPEHRYDALNAAIGALEAAKLELYRRVVAPYEGSKMAINGDVYGCTRDNFDAN